MAYQRIVCFKFKSSASKEAIQRHMQSFAALQDAIPPIQSYAGGLAVPTESGEPPAYDSMHYITFACQKDVKLYYDHKVHQEFIQENKGIWEDVFVLNALVD